MIARRATRAIGAATGIGIRSDTRLATSVTARTTVAVSRIVFASIVAAATAAAGRASVAACCPFCGCGPSGDQNYNFNPGPPVAQTAYPYYTLRGPRDFLLNNPPSIGPY